MRWPVCESGFNRPLGPDQSRFCPMLRLREMPGWAPEGPLQHGYPVVPGQYRFFGGNDRLICLRRRATAAAFLRLRSVVGFS
ncbi:hypothetical protein BTH42_19075 [Burkholderia sp. SRS-W-2-2016]|nr:hypothetical protein BTH42_19075 [Burkholderia sp. SRS-W-2-2016]